MKRIKLTRQMKMWVNLYTKWIIHHHSQTKYSWLGILWKTSPLTVMMWKVVVFRILQTAANGHHQHDEHLASKAFCATHPRKFKWPHHRNGIRCLWPLPNLPYLKCTGPGHVTSTALPMHTSSTWHWNTRPSGSVDASAASNLEESSDTVLTST